MNTLLLDVNTWDLTLDGSGNIALATGVYAQAQDVASEIKLFEGELWYDTTRGIPYWSKILGYIPQVPLITAKYNDAALLVPGVVRSETEITSVSGRLLTGTVFIANAEGQTRLERLLAIV